MRENHALREELRRKEGELQDHRERERTLKEGGKTAGLNSVQWDGKDNLGNVLPPANYKVEVSAKDSNGNAVAASTRFEGMVSGVSFEQGIPLLEINGAKVSVGDVLTVRQAPATQQGGASTP